MRKSMMKGIMAEGKYAGRYISWLCTKYVQGCHCVSSGELQGTQGCKIL